MSELKKPAATRPLPKTNELDTQAFWAGTKEKEFRYQQCANCNTVIFYPRNHCTGCMGDELVWKIASGKATIYTYSVVRQSYHPFFRNQVPYVVAWVDLDEGPRIQSNIVGVDDPVNNIKIGQAVQLEWEEHEDLCIPLFRPV